MRKFLLEQAWISRKVKEGLIDKVGTTNLRIQTGPEKEHEEKESKPVSMITYGKEIDVGKELDENLSSKKGE